MAKKLCIDCNEEVGTWRNKHGSYGKAAETKSMFKIMGISEPNLENSEEGDIYCAPSHNKLFCRHAVKIWKYYESTLMPEEFEKLIQCGEDWIPIAKAELSSMKDTQTESSSSPLSKQSFDYFDHREYQGLDTFDSLIHPSYQECDINPSELSGL